jgi:hypothetical protein
MKRALVFLLGLAVAATFAYFATQRLIGRGGEDQLTWLRREFKLTAAQTAAIERLQTAYAPVCAEHCRLIQEATTRATPVPAEIARLEQVCHEATLRHLREIAAVMAPAEARRFLALVEPKVTTRPSHDGPLGLK